MSNQETFYEETQNYSKNFHYLLECCNISYTQGTYMKNITIPQCNLSLSTIKNVQYGRSMSPNTARVLAASFSMFLNHSEKRALTAEDLYMDAEEFKKEFPATVFLPQRTAYPKFNLNLFTNKLFRCYYMVSNSPHKCYMGYFKLFEDKGSYHAYLVRGIQNPEHEHMVKKWFETPKYLYNCIQETRQHNKNSESFHLFEAHVEANSSHTHEEILFNSNNITIHFRSKETDPNHCTMYWNTESPTKFNVPSYIGGSCLMVNTNDGSRRSGSLCAYKMGLEAIEGIPKDQQKIVDKGPFCPTAKRLLVELQLQTENGLFNVGNNDDNNWFHFIQTEAYRTSTYKIYDEIDVEKLIDSLISLEAKYQRHLDLLVPNLRKTRRKIDKILKKYPIDEDE